MHHIYIHGVAVVVYDGTGCTQVRVVYVDIDSHRCVQYTFHITTGYMYVLK